MSALTIVLFLGGCHKDSDGPSGGSGVPSHLELSVDSACVQAPNVITPVPNDGINSLFFVLARNVTAIQIRITNAQGDRVFTSTSALSGWDGTDSTGTGPYDVFVQATTTSGIVLSGTSKLHVLSYGNASCLTFNGTPVCGDQLDPRICGVTLPSNEVFCD